MMQDRSHFLKIFGEFESYIKGNKGSSSLLHLNDLRRKSWELSKAASESPAIMRPLRKRIKGLNNIILSNRMKLAQTLGCNEMEVKELMITMPQSRLTSWAWKITLPLRLLSIVLRILLIFPIYAIASIFFKKMNLDPKTITNNKTPVLLVHGSNACQREWDFFRQWIKSEEVGHIFSLNLNESAFFNDKKEIKDYAEERLAPKLKAMRKQYSAAGHEMNEVILVGHSMGSLVAGVYATVVEKKTNIRVKSLISISSPWYGSPIADKFISKEAIPEKVFRREYVKMPPLRKMVLEKYFKGEMGLYTFSSSLDPMVPVSSSSLPIAPSRQVYHNNHDHYTTMTDYNLATKYVHKWIAQYTSPLKSQ